MDKYFIITYGCQMNKSDSERIAKLLENFGYKPAKIMSMADVIIINMCSVRQSAVDKVWGKASVVSRIKSKNPRLLSVLTGCILQKDKYNFAKKFDLVLNIKELSSLRKVLRNKRKRIEVKDYLQIEPKYQNKFSAFVPIMTGCNNFCTYCVVPYTRGRENFRPAKKIINEIKNLIEREYKEVWLLGQNVNSYKDGKIDFSKLLKMVNDIKGSFWIRFTSPHPKDFSDELIKTMADCNKVTEYLNLPVQSGDDEILKEMNRPYTIRKYKKIIKKIRTAIPNISLSTDVIVGFPGETKRQFENTVKLFKEIKYDMAYIAQYSSRSGTVAARMKDNISFQEKSRRRKVLTEILKKTALEKNEKYVGKTIEVLTESSQNNILIGKTRTYKTVKIHPGNKDSFSKVKPGKFVNAKITNALPWGLRGVFI